jgi:hypothetical protein
MTDPPQPDESSSQNSSSSSDPGFAPAELTDGRVKGDWKTRYPDSVAQRAIRLEVAYVLFLSFFAPVLMAIIDFGWPRAWLNLDMATWVRAQHYSFAWLGGLLGGSLFTMKWMYHSVAKGTWNQDRRLWRIFTPLLSAGVGFTVVVLSAARVLPVFGEDVVSTNPGALAVGILVGYFSDLTMSRIAEVAFGALRR